MEHPPQAALVIGYPTGLAAVKLALPETRLPIMLWELVLRVGRC